MTIVKWLAGVVLALVVLPLAALVAVNAFDERLTPEAVRYGESRAPGVPDAQNGYYALLALSAGDGEDGMVYAKAWLAEARAAARENREERHPPAKRAKRPDLCDTAQESCLEVLKRDAAASSGRLEAYREDLDRYERLLAFRRYEEVLDYELRVVTALPGYADLRRAQQAYLVRAALAAHAGDAATAVAAVERDVAFQRVMLGGARTLLGKMVACAGYWRDLAFVADLLERRTTDLMPLRARLKALLEPLDPAALRIASAMETEFSLLKHFLKEPAAPRPGDRYTIEERIALTFFYKPNATINREVARFLAMAAADRMPVNQGSVELDRIMRDAAKMRLLDYVDNPAGNLLVRWAMPEHGADAYNRLRLHDLDAYNRLVGLRVELMEKDVTLDGVAEFVARAGARFHDPYTGKPMAWDRASRRLSFTAKSRSAASRKLFSTDRGRVYLQFAGEP